MQLVEQLQHPEKSSSDSLWSRSSWRGSSPQTACRLNGSDGVAIIF
jgi:hypothetical protein